MADMPARVAFAKREYNDNGLYLYENIPYTGVTYREEGASFATSSSIEMVCLGVPARFGERQGNFGPPCRTMLARYTASSRSEVSRAKLQSRRSMSLASCWCADAGTRPVRWLMSSDWLQMRQASAFSHRSVACTRLKSSALELSHQS
jgi:hypothetical protein